MASARGKLFARETGSPFLKERVNAFLEIRAPARFKLARRFHLQLGVQVVCKGRIHHSLDTGDRGRGTRCKLRSHLLCFVLKLSCRNDLVDHSHLDRALGRDGITCHKHLGRKFLTDCAGKKKSSPTVRGQSDTYKYFAERSFFVSDNDIACEGKIDARTGTSCIDSGNERNRR